MRETDSVTVYDNSACAGRHRLSRFMRLPAALAFAPYEAFSKTLYTWNLRRQNRMPEPVAASRNADAGELARFSALASRWWDPESEFRPLHRINPLRLGWINALAPLAGRRVLDVGCGGGILAEAMADHGAQVIGIDLAEAPLAVAALHARQHGAAVEYQAVSAEELAGARPAEFDVVTCMEMLEHVPRPAETVAACARLVRPGGWVFFSTINRTPLSYVFAILGAEYILRMLPRGTHQWRRFIQPGELVRMAAAHGLVLHDSRGLGYNPFTRHFRLHRWTGVGYLLAFRAPH